MIFASFSTFEINSFFYEIFVYYSIFQKKITFDEILKFVEGEQFKYLVLESINDNYYGFILKNKLERKTAKEIVWGNWTVLVNADEYVIGLKVAKELPSWVNNAIAWEGFVIDIEDHAAGSEGLPSPEESISDNMSFNSEGSGTEWGAVANINDSDDVGEEEKALYDEEEVNDEEDEEQDVNEVDKAKDEEEEEQEDSKVGEETAENKEHMSSDIDDTDEESDASVSTNVHPKAKKQSSDSTLKYAKKSVHNQSMWRMLCSRIYLVVIWSWKLLKTSTNHPKQSQLGFISQGLFATVKHATVAGLWFMEIIETRGCSNLNS